MSEPSQHTAIAAGPSRVFLKFDLGDR